MWSNFGDYGYEVIDTKLKKPKIYSYYTTWYVHLHVRGIQGALPLDLPLILKDMKKEYIDVSQVYDFFNTHRKRHEIFVEDDVDHSTPENVVCDCQICHWQEECKSICIDNDHLNQIGGLTKVHLKTLYQNNSFKR